jgi:hypothetical protein
MPTPKTNTIRRSVALPRQLMEEVVAMAPPELRENWNRLVIASLRCYLEGCRAEAAERAMAEMAQDPQVQAECASVAHDFAGTEGDGLRA